MTQWSGNHVQVGGATVYVNAKPVLTPAKAGNYSSRRRAFLVAGNISRVTNRVYGEAPSETKSLPIPLPVKNRHGTPAYPVMTSTLMTNAS